MVGDGSKLNFGKMYGLAIRHSKKLTTNLWYIVRIKEATIADLLIISNGILQWNITFLINAQSLETDVFTAFFDLVYFTHLLRGVEDKIFWCPSKKGKLAVRSLYQAMTMHNTNSFSWKGT